jgi:4-hydroxybenzoate polyprenyltransferase
MTPAKLRAYAELMRLDRPYGTLLVLLPALWGLVIAAEGAPSVALVLIFGCGAFVMRSAGCIINDLWDRDLDREVARTRERPLPSGRATPREALVLFGLLCMIALGLASLLNRPTLYLSVGGFALALTYPLMKRFVNLPQMVMGVAFGWGALMAWTAVRGALETPALLLFGATVAWATAYDTIYALMDRDDDARIGIGSSVLAFGRHTWLAVAALFGVALLCLTAVGRSAGLGPVYYVAVLGAALAFGRQAAALRGTLDRERAFALFKSHVGVGTLVLIGMVLAYV